MKAIRVSAPNQAWASDITYIRLWTGFAYLSLLTDYYSRKVAGRCLSRSLEIAGSFQALQLALSACSCTGGLVHHSDHGIQYCSIPWRRTIVMRMRQPSG
ncbi:MAG: DDE-type integrase/transposase/recombinase [Prevotellaceae bacterium]|nr:DDE-type integrase/transposase/recombinase [Prevotellaceae bacterium]